MNHQLLTKWYLSRFESKKSGNNIDRISMTLLNSKIKLTPHQIDAALFAFKSPISNGVLLADEVGLGKTIEAGIIIAQLWYERKANVLIIVPASLMRQWNAELYDKFSLKSELMDRKRFNYYLRKGYENPFLACGNITICSYQFASINSELINKSKFDTVVIDEAHKLRNSYTGKSIISNNIKEATKNMKKILLTATPIQNSLLDLYGITSFIDDKIFGDINIFKLNYIKKLPENTDELKSRLQTYMHRTLRSQVSQYVKYTNRIAKTFSFSQTPEEIEIYKDLQDIIINSENNPYIIPKKQSHLLLLILSKLMGSSVYALQGTLQVILKRLELMSNGEDLDITEYLKSDDLLDEVEDDELINEEENEKLEIDKNELNREILVIKNLIEKTNKVNKESKYFTLLESLKYSFMHLKEIGANEKVLIFTESTRTQKFLYDSLKEDGYDHILLYNGSNNNDETNEIYSNWLNRPENIDKKNNDRSLNIKSAIIDEFEKNGKILISTEAGAEGLNLQFCSLVINYDLPWNPQRVEQRIGRCHRFGQKFDVTVINFINNSNRVEQRIYELLNSKFNLFNEVFGASDEVLGALDNVTNIDKSISEIYAKCRTEEEIDTAFDELQKEYSNEISDNIKKTKQKIIDNFEEDLQQYFSNMMVETESQLNEMEKTFWELTKIILSNVAHFDDASFTFTVYNLDEYNGKYKISSRNENSEYIDYNSNTKLGQLVLNKAHKINISHGKMTFDITNYPFKLTEIEQMKGKKGIILFNKFSIRSFESEEYLFFSGLMTDNEFLDDETINKLFRTNSIENYDTNMDSNKLNLVLENSKIYCNKLLTESTEKNNSYLSSEISKINTWADDKMESIEYNVEMMREQRKELRKQSDLCTNYQDKLKIEQEISNLTNKISNSWMKLADTEEKVEIQRKQMISNVKKENMKSSTFETIFAINFEVI